MSPDKRHSNLGMLSFIVAVWCVPAILLIAEIMAHGQ